MSNPDSKDDVTALVVRSAHDLATRSSLVIRGLRDISSGLCNDTYADADRAVELVVQRKFDEAIVVCDNGLKANPRDELFWQIKGVALAEQGKYDAGLKCLYESLAIDDQNPHCWALAAKVLRHFDHAEEEMRCWCHALEISPDYAGAWREVGNCLVHLGRYREAVQAFDSELRLNPSDESCISQREAVLEELARDF